MLAGLIQPTQGAVLIEGTDISNLAEDKIAYCTG